MPADFIEQLLAKTEFFQQAAKAQDGVSSGAASRLRSIPTKGALIRNFYRASFRSTCPRRAIPQPSEVPPESPVHSCPPFVV
jgi:hypothetical protein